MELLAGSDLWRSPAQRSHRSGTMDTRLHQPQPPLNTSRAESSPEISRGRAVSLPWQEDSPGFSLPLPLTL